MDTPQNNRRQYLELGSASGSIISLQAELSLQPRRAFAHFRSELLSFVKERASEIGILKDGQVLKTLDEEKVSRLHWLVYNFLSNNLCTSAFSISSHTNAISFTFDISDCQRNSSMQRRLSRKAALRPCASQVPRRNLCFCPSATHISVFCPRTNMVTCEGHIV